MGFELYKSKGGKTSKPNVTITTAGTLSLSKACFDKYIGNREFAQLYYDKDKGLIGIKGADKEGDSAFKITRSAERASGSIAGRSFLNHLEIDYSKPKKVIPEWNEKEGMLIVKL
jgi:hypothetical protein